MKVWKWVGIIAACIAVVTGAVWLCLGDKISLIYTSLNSFKDENLAYIRRKYSRQSKSTAVSTHFNSKRKIILIWRMASNFPVTFTPQISL